MQQTGPLPGSLTQFGGKTWLAAGDVRRVALRRPAWRRAARGQPQGVARVLAPPVPPPPALPWNRHPIRFPLANRRPKWSCSFTRREAG